MKVAIIGAGAIGGYIGARMAEIGHDVTLVARGPHLAAIRSAGLYVESPHGNAHIEKIAATDDITSIGPVDVVVAAVKLPDLDAAASQFPVLMGEATRIVTLQNGIDARAIIGAHVDAARVAQGIIYLAAAITEPGRIKTPGGKYHMLVDAMGGDATMAAFFDAIDAATALEVTRAPDGDVIVWQKFTAQASIAAVTALTRLPLGGVFASDEATGLLKTLFDEALAVAAARGIDLGPEHRDHTLALYAAQPGTQSSSLAIDIANGKRSELEYLSGRVHALGKELGVPTPAHSVTWAALAAFKDGPPVIRG